MTEDEYRELEEAALKAIGDLLRESEPGTGLYMHETYARLKSLISEPAPTATTTMTRERTPDWFDVLSVAERAREVLEILSEHRLTIGELTERLQKKHDPDLKIYISHVRSAVTRLYNARELDREPETFRKTRTRYRYFQRTSLDGPIVDLERAFHENGGEA
jgi:hypothetical protein